MLTFSLIIIYIIIYIIIIYYYINIFLQFVPFFLKYDVARWHGGTVARCAVYVLYTVNAHRADKTIEAFNLLPEEFTAEDVMINFSLASDSAARSRVRRLIKDNLVIKTGEVKENGTTKSIFKKTGKIMR